MTAAFTLCCRHPTVSDFPQRNKDKARESNSLIIATLIIDWRITLFFVLQPVGLNMLMSGINNHLSHTDIVPKSYRNYESKDNSHNLPGWTNLLLLGEGYHHNHHHAPWKYDNADKPGEWDLSGWVIRTFFDIHRGKLGSDYKRY